MTSTTSWLNEKTRKEQEVKSRVECFVQNKSKKDKVCESTSPKCGLGETGIDFKFGCDGTPETRCQGIPSRRGVNLGNLAQVPGSSNCGQGVVLSW